jgi:hypothetical protein
MPYRERLSRWLIVRLLPNLQQETIAGFVKRSDAEGYVKILRRLNPEAQFEIMFSSGSADRPKNSS